MQTFLLFALIILSVVLMVVAISKLKLHPFIVMTVIAMLVGLVWGILYPDSGLTPAVTIDTVKSGFGSIMTSIGIVILCGTIIGTILEKTGAALTMANTILKLVGKKNSVVAMGAMGYVTGIPVFCDSGFVVLSPISRALASQSNISLAVMATALSGGLYATHCLVPPTPGPIAMAGTLEADLGLTILIGLVVSIPAVIVAILYALKVSSKIDIPANSEYTYEELQAELESYIAKLEEARKAGDNVAQADALKNIQDLGRRIKTAGDAGQLTSTQVKGLAGQITIAATRILGMSSSLRGAIPFIHLFGTTIKTAMGPLGWAMLLIQGLTAGITALIDHFKAKSDELERQAEQATERMKKRARDAAESIKKSYEAIQDYNKSDRTQEINKGFEDFIKGITAEYRLQTQEIERQIQLRREETARQKGIDTQEAELARVKLDNDFEDGKITERQRDYGMMMINQNLDDKIRRRDLEVAQKEFMDYGKQLDTAVQNRDRLQDKDFDMKFIQGQMPSLQEVERLFQQQVKAQERIDASNRELKKVQEEIDKSEKKSSVAGSGLAKVHQKEKLEELRKKEQRVLSAHDAAKSEGNAATIRINELRDLFRQSGVNFEPSYQQGTDVTSRTREYQKALEDQSTKAKELADKLADAREEAGKLGDIMGAYERNIVDQERSIRTQDRLNSANIDLFNKRADKKEAQEAKKTQEKLEKEQGRELKKLQREQQQETNKAIKTFVEGFTINAGKSATPHQTSLVHKAIDGIRKDIERAAADGYINPEELQNLNKLFVGKLTELGVASRQVLQGLKQTFESNIGAINKEITEIKRTQRMQLSRERLRR